MAVVRRSGESPCALAPAGIITNRLPSQAVYQGSTEMEIKRFETKARMSRAVVYNNTVYLCGQVGKDASKGITEQTATTLEKIEELLESVGSNKDKILSATIYIKDMAYFADMNAVWDAWVTPGMAPARACVQAAMAREELLVEISIVAAV
ncbi:RidA family protein [Desulfoluna spongiiphila]|uniref:Enamine deaminase RidA, house cleaning of reactive enamine intermediates, YjgF/YER057c/UK114 family n=1 Tax=Desulfoluna spongiiphila TaxID=419481 RepID=A0A1G5HJI8_9BACT|nr:RidA family protein [Desulfoluna spongiiphila]SCY63218.1 Enamine deaminase RidA, house cleaning of reactive enamine intermediates, YjgF/YER057c/UK114 family [Desulfoluna spongiiphila]VVS93438.1 yjgf/yer057c/uk114 family [Desulfoluna spongiiphila]